jgi:putative phosphoribosyl transferase
MSLFKDRQDAGRHLAEELSEYAGKPGLLVLALPRGGVPVAYQVARALNAPLDVFLVRKLGLPGQEELAMGAIASGGVRVMNEDLMDMIDIPEQVLEATASHEQQELERRERLYRGDRPFPQIEGRTVILIDDGLATGASMRAAVLGIQAQKPGSVVVAVPVAAPETCREFEAHVDSIVCAVTPEPFYGVGYWYEDFLQTTDEEVRELLESSTG